MVYLLQSKLAAVSRPTLVPGADVAGVVDVRDQFLRPNGNKAFFASGPNSSTAYSATVSIWTTFDKKTWDPTPIDITITNLAPDASAIVATPLLVFAASMVVTGTITTVEATNGRTGIDVGVEG